MMVSYTTTNAAVLSTFGERVTFATRSGSRELLCLVERPASPIASRRFEQSALPGAVYGQDDLRVTALSDDLRAAGIAVRDTAVIDGVTYTVNSLWPDDGGMTTLELRA